MGSSSPAPESAISANISFLPLLSPFFFETKREKWHQNCWNLPSNSKKRVYVGTALQRYCAEARHKSQNRRRNPKSEVSIAQIPRFFLIDYCTAENTPEPWPKIKASSSLLITSPRKEKSDVSLCKRDLWGSVKSRASSQLGPTCRSFDSNNKTCHPSSSSPSSTFAFCWWSWKFASSPGDAVESNFLAERKSQSESITSQFAVSAMSFFLLLSLSARIFPDLDIVLHTARRRQIRKDLASPRNYLRRIT